jgi:hypothetical protein
MRKIQTLAAMLIGLASAHAEVIVVDANDGPGADFTSLSAAIAAAKNGDVLLMRSGTYDGIFSIVDKAIAIIADDGADVVVTSTALTQVIDATIQVSGTPPGTVLLRGLTLASDPPASTAFARPALTVQHNGASRARLPRGLHRHGVDRRWSPDRGRRSHDDHALFGTRTGRQALDARRGCPTRRRRPTERLQDRDLREFIPRRRRSRRRAYQQRSTTRDPR